MDGVVTRLGARDGEMVVVGVQNQPGTILMTISDLSSIDAEVEVAEADVLRLAVGQPATVDARGRARPSNPRPRGRNRRQRPARRGRGGRGARVPRRGPARRRRSQRSGPGSPATSASSPRSAPTRSPCRCRRWRCARRRRRRGAHRDLPARGRAGALRAGRDRHLGGLEIEVRGVERGRDPGGRPLRGAAPARRRRRRPPAPNGRLKRRGPPPRTGRSPDPGASLDPP